MTKLIASLAVVASLVAGMASAYAHPTHTDAVRETARMGQITQHGVFDAR